VQAKRSLPKLTRSAGDREKLNRVFDSLEAQADLDPKQQALLADLRKLVPRPVMHEAARARKIASARAAATARGNGNMQARVARTSGNGAVATSARTSRKAKPISATTSRGRGRTASPVARKSNQRKKAPAKRANGAQRHVAGSE